VGLHPRQGLAVVRVGARTMLVSFGEGGARMLTELTPEDLGEVREGDLGASVGRGARSGSAAQAAGHGLGILLVAALLALPAGAVGGQELPGLPPGSGDATGSVRVESGLPGSDGSLDLLDRLPPMSLQVGRDGEGLHLDGPVGTVVVLGLLAIAPTLLLLTTSFTRILVVLHLMRQALGTQNTPPGHLLAGLALLLSSVVMAPTLGDVRALALDPWLAGEIDEGTMISRAEDPMRDFMLRHVREADLRTFLEISRAAPPAGPEEISNTVLMSAFVTSELRAAFEIGFALFLPFVVIDLVVAAVLTSMGMFMLPPTMIALPCKLMLFVLMDGWSLLLGAVAESFA